MGNKYLGSITLASVEDGQSGVTLYTWIRYSNGAETNPSVTSNPQSDTKQIGFAYNQTSNTPTNNYSDYTWSDYIGTSGADGVGITSIVEQYNLSTSNSQAPGESDVNWKNTPDPWVSGKYYWTRSRITWTNNTITYTEAVLAQGLNSANSTAYTATTELSEYMHTTDETLGQLQNQIDGQVEVWYFEVNPGTSTDPSLDWTTDEEKARHIGDLYYNVDNGHSWRWLDQGAGTNPRYIWQQIPDSDAAAALAAAQAAQTTANNKRRIFTAQPTPPYDIGDLWVNGSVIKYCQTARAEGQSYNSADWILTATDDTWAQQNALTQVDVQYAKNTDPETAPTTGWSTDAPEWEDGKYIWTRTVTYINGVAQTPTDPVCITGAKGETGAAAPYITLAGPTNIISIDVNNNTITPTSVAVVGTYANTTINSWSYSVNGGTYSTTAPAGVSRNGNTVTITSAEVASTTKTIAIKAANTIDNVSDIYTITRLTNGQDGQPGSSSYTYIRYADDAQGTNISPTVLSTSKYVAIQITNSATPPTTGWVWQKFVGENGEPGAPATQYYTYVRYSENSDGRNYTETPTNATKYVGICVVTTTTPPVYSNSAWKWSKYVGEDGAPAIEIVLSNESHTLTAAADGSISSYSGAYTDVYIYEGTENKSNDYSISKTDPSGVTSTINGKRVTVNSVTNGVGGAITITVSKNNNTVGTKQFTISVSKAGNSGTGIQSTTIYYGYNDDGEDPSTVPSSRTSQNPGGWDTSVPAVPQGKYLWTKIVMTYTNGTTHTSYSVTYISMDGEPGVSGDIYRVESNHDFIYTVKHDVTRNDTFIIDTDTGADSLKDVFSPISVEFEVYKGGTVVTANSSSNDDIYQDEQGYIHLGTGTDTALTPGTGYWYDFLYLGPNNQDFSISLPIKLDANGISSVSGTIVYFNMRGIYEQRNSGNYSLIYDACLAGNAFFAFVVYADSLKSPDKVLTRHVFYLQNLLSSNFASFETTANSIKMAVDHNALSFDEDGLTIYNGDLTIYTPPSGDTPAQKVFYFDTDKGKLHIDGDGEFSGTIEANQGHIGGISISDNSISSTNGNFSINANGSLTAKSGLIGGFKITDNALVSTETGAVDGSENIRLYGSDGAIYAKNITLGEFASIEKYIQVGTDEYTSYIYNPDYAIDNAEGHLPYFFKVNNNVYLTADGQLNLNRIVLDGSTSTIKGTGVEQDPNFGWPDFYITPEKAYFRNVDISGKISTMVFEVGHTQAVGGSMLFKPSYKIASHNVNGQTTILTLEDDPTQYLVGYKLTTDTSPQSGIIYYTYNDGSYTQFSGSSFVADTDYYVRTNPYIMILDDNGSAISITTISSQNGKEVTVAQNLTGKIPVSMIVMGEDGDMVIGINSTNSIQDYMRPRGLTISEFNHDNTLLPTPKVYLGDLSKAGFSITGLVQSNYNYGLYSNNVILNGSLTTQITSEYLYKEVIPTPIVFEEDVIYLEKVEDQYIQTSDVSPDPNKTYYVYTYTYAGVNTLSQVSAKIFDNYFDDPDTTKIVYWAGSQGVSGTQIQESPFQVTEKGSIYARNGLFTGAIIAKSVIKGVDIYAARIHGAAQDNQLMEDNVVSEYGLAFYNAAQGLVFKTGGDDDQTATTVFGIGSNGLYTENNTYFININNNTVAFNGNSITVNTVTSNLVDTKVLTTDRFTIGGTNNLDRITYNNGIVTNYIDFDYNNNIMINQGNRQKNSTDYPQINIGNDIINFQVTDLVSTTNFQLGMNPGQGYMRYKQVANGYDLYV